jgi:hypothetical protein
VRLAKRFMAELGYNVNRGDDASAATALKAATAAVEELMAKAGPNNSES